MIVFYVSLTVVIVFEYAINPWYLFTTGTAEHYLAFSIAVSVIVLGFTVYSFLRLLKLIKEHRPNILGNVS